VRLVANPLFLRAVIVLFCAAFAFLPGLLGMRTLRQNTTAEGARTAGAKTLRPILCRCPCTTRSSGK